MIELILSQPILVLGIFMVAGLIVFLMVVFAIYDCCEWLVKKWQERKIPAWHRHLPK